MNGRKSGEAVRVRDILETSLYATDLDAMETFYRDILGLEVVVRAPGRHVFFRCGGRMLLIFNPLATRKEGDLPPHGCQGAGHIAFGVPQDEVDAWRTRLIGRGIAIEQETIWPNGTLSLYFRDPAGNSLEVTAPKLWGIAAPRFSCEG